MPCKMIALIALLVAAAVVQPSRALGQEYIVMGTPMVNIRTGPGEQYVVIGRAEKGDIFRLLGTEDGWHKIEMFSGEPRYVVAANFVYGLTEEQIVAGHRMRLPESDEECRSMYRSIQMAKDRAMREAEEIIPASVDKSRNLKFLKIMEDRIILELLHIYGLQTGMYNDLVAQEEKRNR